MTALANQYKLSRTSIYNIAKKGKEALQAQFSQDAPPPQGEGFWVWVDKNAIKRLIVSLRAICGATFSMIHKIVLEAFGLYIGETTIREVCQQAYQSAFQYQRSVSLEKIEQIAVDEMFRWKRCLLTGVDCDSLFIFLSEKQSGRGYLQWKVVLERLQTQRGLNPQQVAADGWSPLHKSCQHVWSKARIVHDINHVRRMIDKVLFQFENRAYKTMEKTLKQAMMKSRILHPQKLEPYKVAEDEAVEKAEQVALLVRQAHEALNIINSETGELNTAEESLKLFQTLSKAFKALNTVHSKDAATYIKGVGKMVVEERETFVEILTGLAKQYKLSLSTLKKAALVYELNKKEKATPWIGSKEKLFTKKIETWKSFKEEATEKARDLFRDLTMAFHQVLCASSAVEWAHSRIGAVLSPQKRVSSGFLCLRVALLNLHAFDDGLRKGKSPHELLTFEAVEDWLGVLGYAPRRQKQRKFKKLGWKRLVNPFEVTWRQNWVGEAWKVKKKVDSTKAKKLSKAA